MMPLAPTSIAMAIPPSSKPKIGFSIDSIVGNRKTQSPAFSPNSEGSERPSSPLSDCSYPNQQRSPKLPTSPAELHRALRLNEYAQLELQHRLKQSSPVPSSTRLAADSVIKHSINNNRESPQTRLSPDPITKDSRTPSPTHQSKGPILIPGLTPPGLVRPFPVVPPSLSELKSAMAPYPPPEMMPTHNPFFAAQFQAAAALAHAQTSQFPPGAIPQHPVHLHNPNMPRESYPLYPWLLNRHGRIFPHRFPGNFLLQPFRKPKRVRTAFSPSQLLKLEHAFENNHYVVGAERKTLAQQLSLSETQVKVWFQNRRTKHKRSQQDEDGKSVGNHDSGNQSSSPHNFEDDDELDVEMDDDCPSDEEDVA